MALDDKFFPEDGTLLTRFDNFMIRQAKKVGEAYQERTGNSYKDLVKNTYFHSSITVFPVFFAGMYLSPILSAIFYSHSKNPDFSTPLEEESRLESRGASKKLDKGVRAFSIGVSSILLFGNSLDLYSSNTLYEQTNNLFELFYGVSFGLHAFADYLSKSGLPKPPKKEAREKAKRRFGIMLPEPTKA